MAPGALSGMSCQADQSSNLQDRLERRFQKVSKAVLFSLPPSVVEKLWAFELTNDDGAGSKHLQKPNPINFIPVTVLVFRLLVMEGKSIARKVPLSRVSIAAAARAFDTVFFGTKAIPVIGECPVLS